MERLAEKAEAGRIECIQEASGISGVGEIAAAIAGQAEFHGRAGHGVDECDARAVIGGLDGGHEAGGTSARYDNVFFLIQRHIRGSIPAFAEKARSRLHPGLLHSDGPLGAHPMTPV